MEYKLYDAAWKKRELRMGNSLLWWDYECESVWKRREGKGKNKRKPSIFKIMHTDFIILLKSQDFIHSFRKVCGLRTIEDIIGDANFLLLSLRNR